MKRAAGLLADFEDRVDSSQLGELQVHEGDVGLEGAVQVDRLEPVAGFAYHLDSGHDAQERDQTLPDDVVIVDDEEADGLIHVFLYLSRRRWACPV